MKLCTVSLHLLHFFTWYDEARSGFEQFLEAVNTNVVTVAFVASVGSREVGVVSSRVPSWPWWFSCWWGQAGGRDIPSSEDQDAIPSEETPVCPWSVSSEKFQSGLDCSCRYRCLEVGVFVAGAPDGFDQSWVYFGWETGHLIARSNWAMVTIRPSHNLAVTVLLNGWRQSGQRREKKKDHTFDTTEL